MGGLSSKYFLGNFKRKIQNNANITEEPIKETVEGKVVNVSTLPSIPENDKTHMASVAFYQFRF